MDCWSQSPWGGRGVEVWPGCSGRHVGGATVSPNEPREWAELPLSWASLAYRAGSHLVAFVFDTQQENGGAHKEADAKVQVHGSARALYGPH